MLNYDGLSKRPLIFRSFAGLEVLEFDALNSKIKESHTAFEQKRLSRGDRKRKIGAGHPFKLPLKDRLLMLLVYYRLYVSSTLAAYLLDLGKPNVLKDIRMLEPLVSEVLPLPKRLHQKVKRLRTLDEVEAIFPGFKAFIDATEQEIPRPSQKLKRKTHYSGKKKRHTVKTQLTVNAVGLIIHQTTHVKGSMHDYSLFKRSRPHLPDKIHVEGDLGYEGVRKDFPRLNFAVPFKRKGPGRGKRGVKAQELPAVQKAFNTMLAQERVVVEHTNSRVKKFLIWGGEFRNRLKHYDVATEIVSGIVN